MMMWKFHSMEWKISVGIVHEQINLVSMFEWKPESFQNVIKWLRDVCIEKFSFWLQNLLFLYIYTFKMLFLSINSNWLNKPKIILWFFVVAQTFIFHKHFCQSFIIQSKDKKRSNNPSIKQPIDWLNNLS